MLPQPKPTGLRLKASAMCAEKYTVNLFTRQMEKQNKELSRKNICRGFEVRAAYND